MTILQSILRFLDSSMTKPEMYGWFHILSLFVTLDFTIVFCRYHKKLEPRKLILWTAVVVTLFEVYKQINYSFSYENSISFDYQWYAFPFQFCSTPMYVGLLAGLTKKGAVHKSLCAYLATYAVFAGAAVMFYPSTVFIRTIGINIQTVVCHGSMIVVGVYLLYSGYVKIEHKTILRAIPVFAVCVLLAATMNEIAYRTGLLERETFDMFFISPYGKPSLPVYSLVQQAVPFPFCLILYILGFTAAAYLMLLMAMGVKAVTRKKAAIS